MVAFSLYVLKFIAVLETLMTASLGSNVYRIGNIESFSEDSTPHTRDPRLHISHLTPVRHYAVHGLCGSFQSKANLYKALKSKFCGLRDRFTSTFVMKLCHHRRLLLDWVEELFDLDRDGYISHFEKNLYRNVK